jgi:ribonuclease P protein component
MNRKYSLKSNYDIEKLVKAKRSVGNIYYAIYYEKRDQEIPKIAISPTKRFKTAVERNYEKRVTKEILRDNIDTLLGFRLLIVIKTTASELTFIQKKKQIMYLIRKVIKENS